MGPNWKRCALSLCLVACSHAADWSPIPPEVWALKEDPVRGIKDAVVLESRTVFMNKYLERILRVRILSDAGRRAVELPEFSETCHGFRGRTVYPDGRVVLFDKRQDFQKKALEMGDFSEKRTVVIPPGVTGNCVVELRWDESASGWLGSPLPERLGYSAAFPFGCSYQTLLQTVEIPRSFPWSFSLISGRTLKPDMKESSGFKIFEARNIPPLEPPPYALSVSLDRPTFYAFFQPEGLRSHTRQGVKAYWDAVGAQIWEERFESGIRKKQNYQALRERVVSKVKARTPQAFAAELIPHLESEIRNTSRLTHEESARWKKGQEVPESKDLDAICKVGAADGTGMMYLFYHLLADAGYAPKLALLSDRDENLFRENFLNPWQASNLMLALEEPGKGVLLFDPSERFAAPGLIPPNFQGVAGLLVDPKNHWSSQPFSVPIQTAAFNQRTYDYALTVSEEEDRFQLKAQFSGYPEYLERRRYLASDQSEQNRSLKERMEKGLKTATISRAEVLNAADPKRNVSWNVEGVLERDSGRRIEVDPFPGMPWPVYVPDALPKERSLAIVMPFLQTHTSRSVIKVPEGFQVRPTTPFVKRNDLGHVSWTARTEQRNGETLVAVTLTIGVDTMFAPPQAYDQLKTFLDWVSQACRHQIVLQKA